jgi:hypothetical protein
MPRFAERLSGNTSVPSSKTATLNSSSPCRGVGLVAPEGIGCPRARGLVRPFRRGHDRLPRTCRALFGQIVPEAN